MSSRQLKKLQAREAQKKQASPEADLADTNEASSDEDEADNAIDTRPRAANVFAAFAALDGDDDGNADDDEDEEEHADDVEEKSVAQAENVEHAPKAKASKKKKKKKKKGKGKEATESSAAGDEHNQNDHGKKKKGSADRSGDGLDEIDRALKELNLKTTAQAKLGTLVHGGAAAPERRAGTRITVPFHDLKVLNELRDVFGRETIQAAQADEAGNSQRPQAERAEGNPGVVMVDLETFLRGTPPIPPGISGRRAAAILHAYGGKEKGDVILRRNPFIEFKDTWPRETSGGLSMRQITAAADARSPDSVVEYTFVHGQTYVPLESKFFTLVSLHHHHPLIQFLKKHPYHISSLIQVSRVAKQDQNAALAADLCERALFSFGRSTLSSFRQKLGEGLARLSFRRPENRQFLLAGYYYIRSLITRGTHRTALAWTKLFLSTMPSDDYALLLYAHVLAIHAFDGRWLLDVFDAQAALPAVSNNPMQDYIRQTLVLARLQVKDAEGARAALTAGMASLPWLYGALFQALNLDVPRSIWGIQPRDDTETLYTQLYVQQAKDVWNTGPATTLLKEVAANLDRLDAATLPPAAPVTMGIARFVYLDGTPATMALVPNDMLHVSPNYDFDPLPPAREDNEFSHLIQEWPWIMAGGAGAPPTPWEVLPEGVFLPPGGGDAVFIEEPEDDDTDTESIIAGEDEDGDGGEDEDDEEAVEDASATTTTSSRREWQPGSGMPGAWVDDDEFA